MIEVRVKETEEFEMGIGLDELLLKDWDRRWIWVNWCLEEHLQESYKLIVNARGWIKMNVALRNSISGYPSEDIRIVLSFERANCALENSQQKCWNQNFDDQLRWRISDSQQSLARPVLLIISAITDYRQ